MPIAHHIVWDGRWYAVINNGADGPCSTCSCTNATVCPSRPSHHPYHLAPLDACPHARSQVGGALQSSFPCCRRSFLPHQKGLVLCGAILLYTAAPHLLRVAKIDLLRVLRGGRSASHAPCRPQGPDGPGMWPSCAVCRVLVRGGQIARGSARVTLCRPIATPACVCSKIRTVCYSV